MKRSYMRKTGASILTSAMILGLLTGCGQTPAGKDSASNKNMTEETASEGEKVFYYGDTTFNAENDEADVNPHNGYAGWACIRYGVGETLFKYSDSMELEPWLAAGYENVDETTWVITLQDNVNFTSGRKMDAQAVKECLDDLIAVHERAAGDLKVKEITAEGQTLTITTTEPVPALMNYLSDPYGCIIDMEAGITEDGNVSGTGPYMATKVETDKGLTLVKNEDYWNGTPKLDTIYVQTITDGDTMTMALQSGELDAAYGLPYASLPLFSADPYTISSCETSRSFFAQMNYATESLQDDKVREAIASAIDKENFTKVLLDGNGTAAGGPYPESFSFGDATVTDKEYDLEAAKALLGEAGWTDSDGDGYVDKDGEKLTIRWVTYPSRQELPLLAESVQATMKDIGIDIQVNSTASYQDYLDSGDWDIFAGAFVSAPTGDPEYFFTTHCLDASSKNRGGYHSDKLEELEKQMASTFDAEERAKLATQMTQTILDDHSFVFASHLKMSIVSGEGVTGLVAHPSDYYEITVDLDKN
ncbi:MAG: ABC transporter substrate-binding protein [Clostridia bacterium]|nr:ABC transporter substrate-binding protein [Clostridia bacterium]NCC42772.1 ABC transporter substrate-binding protein [Clostridia bacterium]